MPATKRQAPAGALVNLDRKRSRLTRLQEQQIRNIFNFLGLPAELRNHIYDLCLDTDAAQNILHRYYLSVRKTKKIGDEQAPLVHNRCPPILLVNRQTYREASSFIPHRALTFDHRLLDLAEISDFVPKSLLRTVSSITINDSGHNLFKQNILSASWYGYTSLLQQLGQILGGPEGNNLTSFTLCLESEDLKQHMELCWENPRVKCGFRDTMREALNSLRAIRAVKNVTLKGLPEPVAKELKARMESEAVTFFSLPRELRNVIYDYAADWSDISTAISRSLVHWTPKNPSPASNPTTNTPTILLLNRQIFAEASEVLYKKPLNLVLPVNQNITVDHLAPNLLHFIRDATLKKVQHLSLRIDSWEWLHVFDPDFTRLASLSTTTHPYISESLHQALAEAALDKQSSQRTFAASLTGLKTLKLDFRDAMKGRFTRVLGQSYPDFTLHESLAWLSKLKELQDVVFQGDLPTCYTEPLRKRLLGVGQGEKLYATVGGGAGRIVELEE